MAEPDTVADQAVKREVRAAVRLAERSYVKLAVKALVTVALLGTIVFVLDTEKLGAAIVGINRGWLGLAIVLSAVFVCMRVVKWVVLTRHNGLHAPFLVILRTMLMSLALGIITPGRVGEVVAVAPFPRESRPKAVMVYLYDRIGELCLVLLFSIPAAVILLGAWGVVLGAGILAACVAGIALVEWRGLRLWFGRVTRLDRIARVNAVLSADVRSPAAYWIAGVVTYVFAYGLIVALVVGAESAITWVGVSILPVVTLSNLVSITVGGLGVREGLAAAMGKLAGMTAEVAAAAFFLSFFFTRVVAGIIGVAWMFLASVGKRKAATG